MQQCAVTQYLLASGDPSKNGSLPLWGRDHPVESHCVRVSAVHHKNVDSCVLVVEPVAGTGAWGQNYDFGV